MFFLRSSLYKRDQNFQDLLSEILTEIEKYVNQGIKEIIFLGQNVNAYHGVKVMDGKPKDLAYLIDKVSEIQNLKRIRYMTSHPIDMT